MGSLTAVTESIEEEKALQQFKERLGDLDVTWCEEMSSDLALLRFLRARNLDLKKAEQMIKTSNSWRTSFQIDSFAYWDAPEEISEGFDVYHTGFDNEGRPVYYAPLGSWASARDLFCKGMEEDCLKYAAKCMEFVFKTLLKTRHQGLVCIVDITGGTYRRALYEFSNIRGIQALIWMFKEYEANYPETLHKGFVINTPSVFYWGFNIVKPLMTTRTLGKISIYDLKNSSWQSAVREIMPESSVPEVLGGGGKMRNAFIDY